MAEAEICVQHIYQGKVMSVWVAWIAGRHEDYVLGRSEKEVRALIKDKVRVDFKHTIDGKGTIATSPDWPGLEGIAISTKNAEAKLIYQINLHRDIVDWKHIATMILMGESLHPVEELAVQKEVMEREKKL